MLIWLPLSPRGSGMAGSSSEHGPTSGRAASSMHLPPVCLQISQECTLRGNVFWTSSFCAEDRVPLYLHFGQKQKNLAISITCDHWENWSF